MLPTNVMSFVKKMVTTEDGPPAAAADASAGTFCKLRQTLSSSLLTAQDRVNKMSPRPSLIPDVEPEPPAPPAPTPTPPPKTEPRDPSKPKSRAGACRVCLKSFKPDDFSKTCKECQQRVCEDCASYSKLDENQDPDEWRCSVCRRKIASRAAVPQGSTDSLLLEVPAVETLARRHSDARLGAPSNAGTGGPTGLAPPRSPELRRHSDVSPASLKELEKLKGGAATAMGKGSTADLAEWRRGGSRSRASSPPRSSAPTPSPAAAGPPAPAASAASQGRRGSCRVPRQRSCDDDSNAPPTGADSLGLGLPAPMPRRASAYDVFAPGLVAPGASPASAGSAGGSALCPGGGPVAPTSRRSSFRVPPPDDEPSSPDRPPTLLVDEDRRLRRRGSQLPDITALVTRGALGAAPPAPVAAPAGSPPLPSAPAVRSQQSVDGEAIRIVIHDVDGAGAARRRVLLRRDPADKAPRTRGFGMRVVGGKVGPDGRPFAYIVWTVPGGPAEKGGLQQGDKVLEWGGVPLTDRSFEEVCSVMDRAGDMVELLVEHATDLRMCDLLEEPRRGEPPNQPGLGIENEGDKTPSSPTRRKLPKTPEQIARAKQVTGRAQLQVWYHGERRELVVALMAADELAARDDAMGFGSLPEAYAQLRLLPTQNESGVMQTAVAPASQSPIWNATLTFSGVSGAELAGRSLQVALWDLCPQSEPVFLGECTVDLEKAFLDDRAVWYRLEDPRGIRAAGPGIGGRSPALSPRGSLSGPAPPPRRQDFAGQRSVSDDVDSIGECTSLLHPDHAWIAGSRRGSSQSETLEVEVYQLNKDFSRSLPGSRRSSFQQQQEKEAQGSGDLDVPAPVYRPERRRSSVARPRDPDEILRNLKQVRGELGRTMSLSGNKSRRSSSIWASGNGEETPPEPGPGQLVPRGRRPAGRAQLKLALHMTKGQLELEVISARSITTDDSDVQPDTYVKSYLRDGEKWLLKKKTRVVRHSVEPQYNQILKYQASEVLGRSLVVMIWQRAGALEHNAALGGCELSLEKLAGQAPCASWYPLYPLQQRATDSSDSP